jgi:hypothetical protein
MPVRRLAPKGMGIWPWMKGEKCGRTIYAYVNVLYLREFLGEREEDRENPQTMVFSSVKSRSLAGRCQRFGVTCCN